ncbi:hypothetical protein [Massilia putida]|nr:hypothetical protein [Massilia putida]
MFTEVRHGVDDVARRAGRAARASVAYVVAGARAFASEIRAPLARAVG